MVNLLEEALSIRQAVVITDSVSIAGFHLHLLHLAVFVVTDSVSIAGFHLHVFHLAVFIVT
jgi:hypothetical protein